MVRRLLSIVVMVALFMGILSGAVFATGEDIILPTLNTGGSAVSLQGPSLFASHPIFNDVRDIDWFYYFVNYAHQWGLFKGTSDTTFSPQQTMTRAMFVTVIFRCYNVDDRYTGLGQDLFSDVKASDYFYDAVTICYYNEVITGDGDGKFHPDRPVTRQEAATMIGRLFDTEALTVPHANYTDSSSIASWASGHVDFMAFSELMEGYPDGSFRPLNNMTRAECAKVLGYFHEILTNQSE